MPKAIIFIGPPASGKGTQADMLEAKFKFTKASPGIVLRKEVENNTKNGKIIEPYMAKGDLVPSDIVNRIVVDSIEKIDTDFVIDGFPREIKQAEVLDDLLGKLNNELFVINIKVSDDEVSNRISGRLSCPGCGSSYHQEYNKPVKDNLCDKCNVELIQRSDETATAIEKRIENYHKITKPVEDFYKNNDNYKYFAINGEPPIADVFNDIISKLK